MYCTYLFTHIDASTKSAAEGNESGAECGKNQFLSGGLIQEGS